MDLAVVGPFSGNHGMAEFARHCRAALATARFQATFVDVDLESVARGSTGGLDLEEGRPTVFLLNPNDFVPIATRLGTAFFERTRCYAVWWWETPVLPPPWRDAARFFDEIWVGSQYIQDAVQAATHVPVHRFPLPTTMLMGKATPSPTDGARFLFTFDYRSTVQRKNPEGVLRAYLMAFPSPQHGVSLTIKSVAAERLPHPARRLRHLAHGRPDVQLIDGHLPREELDRLIAASTCYVSLHRSEGLGMGMLEAQAEGKPVIATGYSGNLTFMPADHPLLVRAGTSAIPRGTPLYGVYGGTWAEPSLEHAAELMRAVATDPAWAREIGLRGRAHLEKLARQDDWAAFVRRRLAAPGIGPKSLPPATSTAWGLRPDGRPASPFVRLADRVLRRFPPLHQLGIDVYYGRFSRRRDRE